MAKYRFEQIAINSTEKRMPSDDDRLTYIGLEHLDSGSLTVRRWGSAVPLKGEKLVMHKGDVLLGKRNAYLRRAAIAPHDGIFSAHGMVLRPREDVIDKTFFPLFIASDYFFDTAIRISVGSLSPTVNWKDLRISEFEIPDLETQKKLAQVLWAMNDAMEAYKKLISITDELVKSQFMEQFGNLNNTQYEVKTLEEICDIIKDGTHYTPTYTDEDSGVRFLSSKDVVTRYIDWTDNKFIPLELHKELHARIAPQKGDILLAKNGTTGICAIVDRDEVFDIYVSLALLRFKPGHDITYMWAAINMPETKKQFDERLKGIGVPNLHIGEIKQTRIIVPPLSLQEQFAAFVRQSDKSKLALLFQTRNASFAGRITGFNR